MSAAQRWMLVALTAAVAVAALLVVWLGPAVVALAWHADRNTAPVVVLHALRPAAAPAGPDPLAAWWPEAAREFAAVGAQLSWAARIDGGLDGQVAAAPGVLLAVRHPSRRSVLELFTGAAWRRLDAGLQARHRDLARWLVPVADDGALAWPADGERVLVLRRYRNAQAAAVWARSHAEAWNDAARRHAGEPVWQVALEPLQVGDGVLWEEAVLLRFPDAGAVLAWAQDGARRAASASGRYLLANQAAVRVVEHPMPNGV